MIRHVQQRTRGRHRPSGRSTALAAIILALFLSGCGSGSNLPSSLPGSVQGSLGSLPTRPETGTPPPTTTPPQTLNTTQAANAGSSGEPSSTDETPWGWIAVVAVLLLAAAGIAGWALARRRSGGGTWPELAVRARGVSDAFHDLVLQTLISAQTRNHQAAWNDAAAKGQQLASDLRHLSQSPPTALDGQRVAAAAQALDGLLAAITIAGSAPDGAPLDQASARVVRDRLDAFAGAVSALPAPLRGEGR